MTRVLVVDDSPFIATWLRDHGELDPHLTVTTITSKFEELLNPDHPAWRDLDVLVCDLMLPGITGTEIMQTCADHHPHVRMIVYSGKADTAENAAVALAHAIEAKPGNIERLFTEIAKGRLPHE